MKNNQFKKILSVLLAVVMLMATCAIGFSSSAATTTGSCGDGVEYSYDSSTGALEIYYTGEGTGAISVSAYSATSQPWYSYNTSIKSVVVGEGVTSLGAYTFRNCTSLTSVSLPTTLTGALGAQVFYYCNSLTTLAIPEGITSIDLGSLGYTTSLKTLYVPTTLTSIAKIAFYNTGNSSLTIYYSGTSAQYSANIDVSDVNSSNQDTQYTTASFVYNFVPSGTFSAVSVASTCNVLGTDIYTCSTTGLKYFVESTTYGAHAYNETADGVEPTIPTCTHGTGYTYTCTVCQEAIVIYGDDIDPTNHSGTQRKYIDENGEVQTYWTCCETTSYITDLADLMTEYSDAVTTFTTTTGTQVNALKDSGYQTYSYTFSSYETYAQLVEIFELIQLSTLEIIENSEEGYSTEIFSADECDFDGWNSYKIRDELIAQIQALTDLDDSTISNFFTYIILGANSSSYVPTKNAAAYTTQHDTAYIATTISTTDYEGFYSSGSSYSDLSTSTTLKIDMSLKTGLINSTTYCIMTVDSAAGVTVTKTTDTSMLTFTSAADSYIAALTAFNESYPTAQELFAAGDDADYSAVTSAQAALTSVASGADLDTLFSDNEEYQAYTEKVKAIDEHQGSHTTHIETVDATCCSYSKTTTVCEDCSFVSVVYGTEYDTNNHLYATQDTVVVEPTCTQSGGTYTYWYCCETIEDTQVVTGSEIAATGHDYVVTEEIVATCCSYSQTTQTCKTCGDEVVTIGEEYDENNHAYDDGVYTSSETCLDAGYTTYTCTNENCLAEKVVYDTAVGHSYVLNEESSYDATCEADGYHLYECENCDDYYTEITDATGHYYFYLVSTVDGTCGTVETKTYKCYDCDATITYELDYDYTNHVDSDGDGYCDCTPKVETDDSDDSDDSEASTSFWSNIIDWINELIEKIIALFSFSS